MANDKSGERDLIALLKGLSPRLDPETYVFATLACRKLPDGLVPLMQFHEAEGLTLIVSKSDAMAHDIEASFESRRITLEIHSSLEAVGLIAAVSAVLSQAGIATNPVAGYFHDHLFVPVDHAEAALTAILSLSTP